MVVVNLMYYVRILAQNGTLYQVQWIDGSKSWIRDVHKHMIQDYVTWRNSNLPKTRSKFRPAMNKTELKQEKEDIEQKTKVCLPQTIEVIDDALFPVISNVAVWCDRCKKWYADNCFKKKDIDIYSYDNETDYLPCNHGKDEIKEDSKIIDILFFKNNIPITQDDLDRLKPTKWLNDELINVYFQFIQEHTKQDLKIGILSSHFPVKLQQEPYQYISIRNWSKKAKFETISTNKIFIPIHVAGNHWTLAVINFIDKRFEYYDSLGGKNNELLTKLRQYVKDEALFYNAISDYDLDKWINYTPSRKNIPQQENKNDCGVFVCYNARLLSRNKALDYDQHTIQLFRKHMAREFRAQTILSLKK